MCKMVMLIPAVKNCEKSEISPYFQLTYQPATVSKMLAEDMDFWVKQTNFITHGAAKHEHHHIYVSSPCKWLRCNAAQMVSCVIGEGPPGSGYWTYKRQQACLPFPLEGDTISTFPGCLLMSLRRYSRTKGTIALLVGQAETHEIYEELAPYKTLWIFFLKRIKWSNILYQSGEFRLCCSNK